MRKAMFTNFRGELVRSLSLMALVLLLLPGVGLAQRVKPKVAILVYDGVQVIDHAIPFEVFGQFSLNEVYTVANHSGPLTTYMGMRILPNYTFEDAPVPDVLVLPGGDAGDAQKDPQVRAWIERMAASADHVLTICTGIFFLVGNDLLDGKQVTTWYSRQDALQRAHPEAHVVDDQIVVESGKLVSAAGLGVEGSLRVLAKLHGPAWAEVVRLNMEHEPVPDAMHIPRATLADMLLPNSVYAVFPWRDATLLRFHGDQREWEMAWRYQQSASLDSLGTMFRGALADQSGWTFASEEKRGATWTSRWCIRRDGADDATGEVSLTREGRQIDLVMRVRRPGQPCQAGRS